MLKALCLDNSISNGLEYFDFLKGSQLLDPQRDYNLDNYTDVNGHGRSHVQILGGGGVFVFREISRVNASKKINPLTKLVCWGAGHNTHGVRDIEVNRFPPWLKNWDLVGIRDYGYGYEWVPCVSCMHPAFDKQYETQHKIAVYEHKDF